MLCLSPEDFWCFSRKPVKFLHFAFENASVTRFYLLAY